MFRNFLKPFLETRKTELDQLQATATNTFFQFSVTTTQQCEKGNCTIQYSFLPLKAKLCESKNLKPDPGFSWQQYFGSNKTEC